MPETIRGIQHSLYKQVQNTMGTFTDYSELRKRLRECIDIEQPCSKATLNKLLDTQEWQDLYGFRIEIGRRLGTKLTLIRVFKF